MLVYTAAGVLHVFSHRLQLPDDLLYALVCIYDVFSAQLEFLGEAMERMQQSHKDTAAMIHSNLARHNINSTHLGLKE